MGEKIIDDNNRSSRHNKSGVSPVTSNRDAGDEETVEVFVTAAVKVEVNKMSKPGLRKSACLFRMHLHKGSQKQNILDIRCVKDWSMIEAIRCVYACQ